MKKAIYTFIFLLMSTFMFAQTVVDIIVDSPDHETLESAVIAAELVGALSGDGPFTVFAPTDAAFDALPPAMLSELLDDPTGDLARILLYHVLGDEVVSGSLFDGQTATTLLGQDISITIDANDDVFINDARVVITNLAATNGVVHVIDAVLMPTATTALDAIENSPVHTILESALSSAGLNDALSGDGPFTVFAPTDAAFNLLPPGSITDLLEDPTGDLARILLHHVISGEVLSSDIIDGQAATTLLGQGITINSGSDGVFINGTIKISGFDIRTLNGVVHVIDAVVMPPAETVVDVVVNSPDHTILETAVVDAELASILSGEGPFTVFAPTDAAFDALSMGALDDLLEDPTGDLARILLYHVLGDEVLEGDLSDGQTATTILGQDIEVTIDANGVFINDAKVTLTNIRTFNGVVHIIDAVMMPDATVVDVIVNSPDHTTLETAVVDAELAGVLSTDGPFTVFAPTDAAFDALPMGALADLLEDPTGDLARILLYHVINDEVLAGGLSDGQTATMILGQDVVVTIDADGVFINDAKVTVTDIRALNGVVHVINTVLSPPAKTVLDVVVNSPNHTTLEDAVIAAELDGTLGGEGPFTVFAPTDAAFDDLADGALDDLLVNPTGDLAQILLHHVLDEEVSAGELNDGQMVTTLQGQDVLVTFTPDGVFIDDAKVIVTDIITFNGIVHVLDAVLMPELTSVKNLNEVKAQVMPNPASDYLQIEFPEELLNQDVRAQIISMNGSVIKSVENINSQEKIDVSTLTSGTYIVLVQSETTYARNLIFIDN